jgi:hypothetical protein
MGVQNLELRTDGHERAAERRVTPVRPKLEGVVNRQINKMAAGIAGKSRGEWQNRNWQVSDLLCSYNFCVGGKLECGQSGTTPLAERFMS